ncbi:hypothetical protein ACR0ST_08765 [Aliidiomarina sp. Khilg15.8]
MKKYRCQAIVDILTNAYQAHHFPEEFDYVYDSSSDAKDRRQGQNPMAKEYNEKVNARRQRMGVAPLGGDGIPTNDESLTIAEYWAEQNGLVSEDELTELVYQTLSQNDPVALRDETERYREVAPVISRKLIDGESFATATPKALGNAFGFPRLKNMHLNFLESAFRVEIIKSLLK